MREVELKIDGEEVEISVSLRVSKRSKRFQSVEERSNKWDFIEMMACPTGCANGRASAP